MPKLLAGYVSIAGAQVTVSPPASFLGTFVVEASVTDGAATAKRSFKVTVTNQPPKWNTTIGTVTAHHSDYPISKTLDGTDPDAADASFLTYAATAYDFSYRARQLDVQLGLERGVPLVVVTGGGTGALGLNRLVAAALPCPPINPCRNRSCPD